MTQRHTPPTGSRPSQRHQQRPPEQVACHQWDRRYHSDVCYVGGAERYQHEIVQWQQDQRQQASRHLAGPAHGPHPEENTPVSVQRRPAPSVSRPPVRPARGDEDWDDDALYDVRPHSSVVRRSPSTTGEQYQLRSPLASTSTMPPIRRASTTTTTTAQQRIVSRKGRGGTLARKQGQDEREEPSQRLGSWLTRLGIGMLIMLLGWMLIVNPIVARVEHAYQDLRYGTPRAAHLSAVVGHNQDSAAHPTYLEVINDHGTVLLLEIPAGDLTKARVYRVSLFIEQGANETPVDLKLVGSSKTPDLAIQIGATVLTWHNTGKGFEPAQR